MSSIDSNSAIVKNDDDIVPLAVFMLLDNIEGPVLLGVDPDTDRMDFKSSIEFSGLRVFSSIDPLDLMHSGYLHALYPWSNPKGQLVCLYFTINLDPEDDTLGEMSSTLAFLVGALIDRHFSQVVRWVPDATINALEETASIIADILTTNLSEVSGNLDAQKVKLLILNQDKRTVQAKLHEMREKIKSLVLDWLHQFE